MGNGLQEGDHQKVRGGAAGESNGHGQIQVAALNSCGGGKRVCVWAGGRWVGPGGKESRQGRLMHSICVVCEWADGCTCSPGCVTAAELCVREGREGKENGVKSMI